MAAKHALSHALAGSGSLQPKHDAFYSYEFGEDGKLNEPQFMSWTRKQFT